MDSLTIMQGKTNTYLMNTYAALVSRKHRARNRTEFTIDDQILYEQVKQELYRRLENRKD